MQPFLFSFFCGLWNPPSSRCSLSMAGWTNLGVWARGITHGNRSKVCTSVIHYHIEKDSLSWIVLWLHWELTVWPRTNDYWSNCRMPSHCVHYCQNFLLNKKYNNILLYYAKQRQGNLQFNLIIYLANTEICYQIVSICLQTLHNVGCIKYPSSSCSVHTQPLCRSYHVLYFWIHLELRPFSIAALIKLKITGLGTSSIVGDVPRWSLKEVIVVFIMMVLASSCAAVGVYLSAKVTLPVMEGFGIAFCVLLAMLKVMADLQGVYIFWIIRILFIQEAYNQDLHLTKERRRSTMWQSCTNFCFAMVRLFWIMYNFHLWIFKSNLHVQFQW